MSVEKIPIEKAQAAVNGIKESLLLIAYMKKRNQILMLP